MYSKDTFKMRVSTLVAVASAVSLSACRPGEATKASGKAARAHDAMNTVEDDANDANNTNAGSTARIPYEEGARFSNADKSSTSSVTRAEANAAEAGASALGQNNPIEKIGVYVNGFHLVKENPDEQMIAHHYCTQKTNDFIQCVIYDGNNQDANLTGIEYIISKEAFELLPEDERQFWHPHNFEILSGQLAAPGMSEEDESKLMGAMLNGYGKTWHTWMTGSFDKRGEALPLGEPKLAWSFNKKGQAKQELLDQRDQMMNLNAEAMREKRQDLVANAQPQHGVNALDSAFDNPAIEELEGVSDAGGDQAGDAPDTAGTPTNDEGTDVGGAGEGTAGGEATAGEDEDTGGEDTGGEDTGGEDATAGDGSSDNQTGDSAKDKLPVGNEQTGKQGQQTQVGSEQSSQKQPASEQTQLPSQEQAGHQEQGKQQQEQAGKQEQEQSSQNEGQNQQQVAAASKEQGAAAKDQASSEPAPAKKAPVIADSKDVSQDQNEQDQSSKQQQDESRAVKQPVTAEQDEQLQEQAADQKPAKKQAPAQRPVQEQVSNEQAATKPVQSEQEQGGVDQAAGF